MSALNPQDIEALHFRLVTFFLDTMTEVELVVPYGKEGVLADICKNVHVLSELYEEKGVCLKLKANPGTQNPHVGPRYSSSNPRIQNLRSWPIAGFEAIRIYYALEEDAMHVIRILHGKRDVRRILQSE
jgi:hypothetical protein